MIRQKHCLRVAVAFVAIGAGLMISGCIQPPGPPVPINPPVPYSEAEFEPYLRPGTARIEGSAFLRTMGGDVKLGAGCTIDLMPATRHTVSRYELARNSAFLAPRDPRLDKHVRSTVGDAQGNFSFSDLPPGDYLLSCNIHWLVTAGESSGGQALARVTVKEGETAKVVLTR